MKRSRSEKRGIGARGPLVVLLTLAALVLASGAALAQTTLHQGTWTAKGYEIEGTWKIVERGGELWVILSEDFKTRDAPDLKIFLSPTPLDELRNRNANRNALRVAELEKADGAQEYQIPGVSDLGEYRSIIIHCERYTKLWGGADLR